MAGRSNRALKEKGGRHRAEKDGKHGTKGRNFSNQPGRSRNAAPTNTGGGNEKANSRASIPGKTDRTYENTKNADRTHRCQRQRQRQANGIGGGFAYLIMSNADGGFDGLDEATSRATATASAEPRIESASSNPPPVLVSTIAGALLPLSLSGLGVSLYRSTISADQTDERSQGTKVLAKSDGEDTTERSGEPESAQQWRGGAGAEPAEGPRLYRFHSTGNALHSPHLFSPLPPPRPHRSAPARQWHACGNPQR